MEFVALQLGNRGLAAAEWPSVAPALVLGLISHGLGQEM